MYLFTVLILEISFYKALRLEYKYCDEDEEVIDSSLYALGLTIGWFVGIIVILGCCCSSCTLSLFVKSDIKCQIVLVFNFASSAHKRKLSVAIHYEYENPCKKKSFTLFIHFELIFQINITLETSSKDICQPILYIS